DDVSVIGDYIEWLAKVDEAGGELAWVTRNKDFPLNTSQRAIPVRRNADQIIRSVLKSKRVQETIKAEAIRRGWTQQAVQAEAEEVIHTMGHRMQMPAVRLVGYAIISVVKRLFDGIFVNSAQLQRIRELFNSDAVVFMPTHKVIRFFGARKCTNGFYWKLISSPIIIGTEYAVDNFLKTYMDFLLMSLLCFDHNIPLPAIAAGMDFMNSKFMGEALRRCGAFFIRRQFGNDQLYWSLFTEYVQTHLINTDHPVEFFVEGTRSRSGKSLYPRYGLLQILIEPFLRCQLYDVMVVPVTINYDKILEESLYAYELLGFPKPKESTSGLLKARHILNKRFGRVYVTFGEPISIRKYFNTSLQRSELSCKPDMMFEVSEKGKMAIRKFGHHVVRIHNKNNVTSVWPYACAVLLKLLDERRMSNRDEIVRLGELVHYLEEIIELAKRLGKRVIIKTNLVNDLRYYLELHSDLFCPCDDFLSASSILKLAEFPVAEQGVIDQHLLERSVAQIILSNYSNQIVHDFADMGLICAILISKQEISRNNAMDLFSPLRSLFDHEFVCLPGEEEAQASFIAALGILQRSGCVDVNNDIISIKCKGAVLAMASIIHPFMAIYQIVAQTVFGFIGTSAEQSLLVVGTQRRVAQMLTNRDHSYLRLSTFSLDPIKNAISSLCSHNALTKQSDGQYRAEVGGLCSFSSLLQSVSPYCIPFDGGKLKSKI
uniref:Phospholipid/glycerol acyltransferase domain-containing protein n=1 Tax=Parascaris univalens TaxID=6257 RepID=A0A915AXB6_PARUN